MLRRSDLSVPAFQGCQQDLAWDGCPRTVASAQGPGRVARRLFVRPRTEGSGRIVKGARIDAAGALNRKAGTVVLPPFRCDLTEG